MGLFSFLTQEIAIDLGTANTIIIHNDKIVVDEPSIVAVDANTGKLIAIGEKARQMHGKTHQNIRTIRPLRDGVIADFNAAELMIRGMIKMINPKPKLGIGIDVEAPEGNMIVDIGGGTTEIAVIALGGIVCNKSLRIAGDDFTDDIQEYMRHQHNIKIGERTAEEIKIKVGAALPDIEDPPIDFIVRGPHQMTSLPMEIPVSYQEIAHCLDKSISKIEAAILSAMEQTPPELYKDIYNKGIWLTGGGALLRGLDRRLEAKHSIPVHVAEDPLHAVARGTGISLKNVDKFSFLLR